MRLLRAEEVKHIDTTLVEDFHMSMDALMENAGHALYSAIVEAREQDKRHRCTLFLCGTGHNGGDGLVAARHQLGDPRMFPVVVMINSHKDWSPLTKLQYQRYVALGGAVVDEANWMEEIPWSAVDTVVDALVGVGLRGPLDEVTRNALAVVEEQRVYQDMTVVAVDVPSGLISNTGQADPYTLRADYTLSLTAHKVGTYLYPGSGLVGQRCWAAIGAPFEPLLDEAGVYDNQDNELAIPYRDMIGHKGLYGHVHILGGSSGMEGAAVLASEGALRAGVGKVSVTPLTSSDVRSLVKPEVMMESFHDLDIKQLSEDRHVLVLGPGLGRDVSIQRQVAKVLLDTMDVPLVIDADGLYGLGESLLAVHGDGTRGLDLLKERSIPAVLTPHLGEFSRLIRVPVKEIQQDLVHYAETFAKTYKVILVLKGRPTLIAHPDGRVYINDDGNPYMAVGGMGDVLAGIIGGLYYQMEDPLLAARTGVYVHAAAGNEALEDIGPGFTPSEVAQRVPKIIKGIRD